MSDALEEATAEIRRGGLVAYPTETVWGLGADARSDAAVARLRRFKGRDPDAPISILVASAEVLPDLGFAPGPAARALAKRFWPGPLTLVMPCAGRFAKGVARADGAVGVRCSPHPVASALAARLHAEGVGPVTATSLNRSGEPAARTREEARALVAADATAAVHGRERHRGERVYLLDLPEDASGGRESTVVDLCGPRPEVLREGVIGADDLAAACAEVAA